MNSLWKLLLVVAGVGGLVYLFLSIDSKVYYLLLVPLAAFLLLFGARRFVNNYYEESYSYFNK